MASISARLIGIALSRLRKAMTRFVALIALLSSSLPALAADPEKINAAFESGKNFLLASNILDPAIGNGIGPAALAGLALLEAEVKPDHGTLVAIHRAVLDQAIRETGTYQAALAIIFLDRYGSAADVPLIQILGARLLAGQTLTAGWGYQTFDALSPADEARVRSTLNTPLGKNRLNAEAARIIGLVTAGRRAGAAGGSDDNSNTQFGIVALWVSRRSGVPSDYAFQRIQSRFMRTQSPGDNGWGYTAAVGSSSPSMTCAGLLGLAAAKASAETEMPALRPDGKPADGDDEDPFFKPPAPGAKKGGDDDDAAAPPPPKVDAVTAAARDKCIERALVGLGQLLHTSPALTGPGGGHLGGLGDPVLLLVPRARRRGLRPRDHRRRRLVQMGLRRDPPRPADRRLLDRLLRLANHFPRHLQCSS